MGFHAVFGAPTKHEVGTKPHRNLRIVWLHMIALERQIDGPNKIILGQPMKAQQRIGLAEIRLNSESLLYTCRHLRRLGRAVKARGVDSNQLMHFG